MPDRTVSGYSLQDPLLQAIFQAKQQQQQQEMMRNRILASFGFSPVWNASGYGSPGLPHMIFGNTAYEGTHGLDDRTAQLLKALLGVEGQRTIAPPKQTPFYPPEPQAQQQDQGIDQQGLLRLLFGMGR